MRRIPPTAGLGLLLIGRRSPQVALPVSLASPLSHAGAEGEGLWTTPPSSSPSQSELCISSPSFASSPFFRSSPPCPSSPSSAWSPPSLQGRELGCCSQLKRSFFGVGDGEEERGVSRQHEERRVIGYSPEQLFDVVAAVDLYEDFVPWCRRSVVLRRSAQEMEAELEIGFRLFNERYLSHVHMKRPYFVKTTVSRSMLFDYLDNSWEFQPGPVPHSTSLHFSVSFQFRSALYRGAANMFFDEVVSRLVHAFENRCRLVYGPSKAVNVEAA